MNHVAFAAGTRLVIIAWVALTVLLGTPYDTSVALEARGSADGHAHGPPKPLDFVVISYLGPLAHWDSVYFVHQAALGNSYDYEQFYAFFPLLPTVIRGVR
jgi:hypothetical protein